MERSAGYFGLTGGIASGKSTVARMFEELGAKIIDADRLGHELLRAPLPTYQEIVRRFGSEILDHAREIDRKRLGAIVFAQPERLRELNAVLHGPIVERVEELAREHHAQDPSAVTLVNAALIFEAGIGGNFAKVLVTWCRPDQQIARLTAKGGLTRKEAEQRIAVQMSGEEKRRRADYVIDCSGSLEETRRQVEAVYPELKRLMGEK